ncbi:MAG: glycoside hydrolase family 3 C-terminal domain-containing protein [Clostridia bacterium]|nr:glycoside hydrolase family 3 C-terminal domain-containing protein [Clostridia bacterium]
MKSKLLLLLLIAALLLPCVACTGSKTPADTDGATGLPVTDPTDALVGSGAVTEADTSAETEADTEAPAPEMGSRMDLIAHTLTAEDGKVTLTFTADDKEEGPTGNVTFILFEGERSIDQKTLTGVSGKQTVALSCPADQIKGELSLYAVATSEGETEPLDEMLLKLKGGLPQLTLDGVRCVVAAMTAEEKAHMVTGVQNPVRQGASGGTYPIDRLGVPSITVNDGPAGVRYSTSVWYPSVHNLSASWDQSLIYTVGQSIGEDSLALGIDIVLGPGMNIQKNVLCGRNFEYCSEDPILTALMSASYVDGMQSTGAGACIKHYAANNQETARGGTSSNVTERALREIYLKAFGMVVADADPLTVMSSYNCLNGPHTSVSYDLLTGILRNEFGFGSFVMSDWGAVGSMAEKVMAGNDVNMPGNATDPADVLAALESGLITGIALDACCYNILTVVAKSPTHQGVKMNTRVDTKNHNKLAAEAAADTVILLQNTDAALPLVKDTAVAVFGNGAYKTVFGGAGSGSVSPNTTVSIMDGLRKGDLSVVNGQNNPFKDCDYHDALDPSKDIPVTEAYAREMAETADAAILVISRSSTEGADRANLKGDFLLNDTERDMMERVSSAFRAKGKKVIVVLNMGSPMEVASWKSLADAILYVGYAGQGTGTALAQVLTGETNPSAKTTITWPKDYESTPAADYFPGNAVDVTYYEDIYVGYRYYSTFGVDVSYPFGFGLSYTAFAYSDFSGKKNPDGTLTATVTVTNTGSVAGREVVQLYVGKPETLQEQAKLELCGFGKTKLLEPGASETLTVTVRTEALMTYDTEGSRWVLDRGNYTLSVGASAADLKDSATLTFDALTVVQDVENRCVPDTTFPYIQKDTYKVSDPADRKENLALNKPTASNYNENDTLTPDRAVDGSATTRWSGLGLSSGNHYWQVDLGQVYAIGEIEIIWESIHVPFTVFLSDDGKTFTNHKMYLDDGTMHTSINLYGKEARFIRLDISRGNAVSIFEFRAFEATPEDIAAGKEEAERVNIALGKPVTATTQEGNYLKDYAVDGDTTTRWGSLPSGQAWLQVDLETVTHVTGLELWLESAWVPYRIEYSVDGEHYETLRSCKKDELLVSLDGLDIDARYIRMWREGENWFSIYEIAVYGV